MPTVGLDGTRFYYEERGKGPALVMVPGTGVDTSMLTAAAGLLGTDHRVITYDRRAFGQTVATAPRPKTYLRRHADDLALLCRELGAVPVTLVGLEWGALVALAAAIHHPAIVRDIVLYDPPLHERASLRATALSKLGFEQRAAKRSLESTFGKKHWKALRPDIRTKLLASPKSVAAELAAGNGEELTDDQLARIKVPVSVVLGAKSPPTPLVRFLPRARVVRLTDDDPTVFFWRPATVIDAMRGVIADGAPAQRA